MRFFETAGRAGREPGGPAAALLLAALVLLAGCGSVPAGLLAEQAVEDEPPGSSRVVEPVKHRSPFGNFLAGRFAEHERDFSRAATALGRALEENPTDLSLMRRTFYVSVEAGHIRNALALARAMDEAGLRIPMAQLLLAAESGRTGDFRAAIARLETTDRSSDLAQISAPLALAWAHVGAGQTDRGLSALTELDATKGLSLLRKLHEGFINDVAGRPQAAEAAFREALGRDANTGPVRVVRALGGFLERQGAIDQAKLLYRSYGGADNEVSLIEEAMQQAERGRQATPLVGNAVEGMAEGFFDVATILPKDRAGEIVLVYVRLALYLNPDFPAAQLLLGEVLDSFGRYAEAAQVYGDIDQKSHYGWIARLRLADDLYNLGRLDAAVRILERMSAERPDRADPLVRLGNILRYEERYGESAAAYDEAIKRLGGVSRVNWTLLYSRGIALDQAGQWSRAEADFLRALQIEPDQPLVLNYLGYSWVEQGRNLADAKEMLERAVSQRQDDGYIVDSMGWALYKLGDFQRAVEYLERAVALLPQDPVINDHLGDAYWQVGRTKEARIQWQRVLELSAEENVHKTARDKLVNGLPPLPAAPRVDG